MQFEARKIMLANSRFCFFLAGNAELKFYLSLELIKKQLLPKLAKR